MGRSLRREITVVIPTLNEEDAIGKVIDDLRIHGYDDLLVVDGFSTDGTVSAVKAKGVAIVTQDGPGKAGAIKTAVERITTPYLVVMDGDGTYSASDIELLASKAEDFVEVIGARTRGRENIPFLNRFGNWFINKLFKLLFSRPITDVCSGMYLLHRDFARTLEITTSSLDIEAEIASQAASLGNIAEVPIGYGPRVGRRKLRPFRDGLRIINTIVWMANYYNPVLLFSMLVGATALPALLVLGWVLYVILTTGVFHSGYALFGVMLFLVASQGWAVAVMSLLVKRSEQRLKMAIKNATKQEGGG